MADAGPEIAESKPEEIGRPVVATIRKEVVSVRATCGDKLSTRSAHGAEARFQVFARIGLGDLVLRKALIAIAEWMQYRSSSQCRSPKSTRRSSRKVTTARAIFLSLSVYSQEAPPPMKGRSTPVTRMPMAGLYGRCGVAVSDYSARVANRLATDVRVIP